MATEHLGGDVFTSPAGRIGRVLVVDDTEANLTLMHGYLRAVHCVDVAARDGLEALRLIAADPPDLVLLDVNMPGLDGFEVCRRIKYDPATRLIPVVMVTALGSTEDRVRALEAGADDFMTKPVERVEIIARVRSALRLKSLYDSLDSTEKVVFALAAAVEAKDSYTEAHTERVAAHALATGKAFGLGESQLEALYRGGLVHDIGKIGVADAILLKKGPLTDEEAVLMREHPTIGERIALPLASAAAFRPIIRHHHEFWDGSGYPDGLRGDRIPLLARIVAVCDSFDALITDRPYRRGRRVEEAVDTLRAGAGTQWDPQVVEVFVQARVGGASAGVARAR